MVNGTGLVRVSITATLAHLFKQSESLRQLELEGS